MHTLWTIISSVFKVSNRCWVKSREVVSTMASDNSTEDQSLFADSGRHLNIRKFGWLRRQLPAGWSIMKLLLLTTCAVYFILFIQWGNHHFPQHANVILFSLFHHGIYISFVIRTSVLFPFIHRRDIQFRRWSIAGRAVFLPITCRISAGEPTARCLVQNQSLRFLMTIQQNLLSITIKMHFSLRRRAVVC